MEEMVSRDAYQKLADELKESYTQMRKLKRQMRDNEQYAQTSRMNAQMQENLYKSMQQNMKRRDEHLRQLLLNAPNIMFLLDHNMKYLLGTRKTAEAVGIDEDTLEGRSYRTLISQSITREANDTLGEEIQRVMQTGIERAFDFVVGDTSYEVSIVPFTDTISDECCVLVIMHDVTDLIAARKAAEEASHAKSDFLSRMSHEIRTPMNAIIGMTAIAKNSQDPEKKDYCLDKIENASAHLLNIINDILDMSKIEANKFSLSSTEFSLEAMLHKVVDVVEFKVEEKSQRLLIRLDEGLPEYIVTDDQRLTQVLTNLISNAVKFTPEAGHINVRVSAVNPPPDVSDNHDSCVIRFEVEDNGIGVTEEQKERLFHSFEQADNNISRKFGGTGLGLAISKKIVELMGGTIWVESEYGKGSKFIFTVCAPRGHGISKRAVISPEKPEDLRVPAADDEPKDNSTNFMGKRILLAEDIEINSEIVMELLKPSRVAVDCAMNGLQAVSMFAADPRKYHMIFMDLQMPEMDGYQATAAIRALADPWAKRIPIVAMTANVFREDIEKCLAFGMNDHIGKPIELETMIDKMKKYI
jgi:PAS domain S-box-containing protein